MNETELRAHFARLRRELASSAPPFRSLLGRDPCGTERERAWSLGLPIPALCLLALAVWWAWERPATISEPLSPAVLETFSTWGTPTDYLLRPPGHELGSTLPHFNVANPSSPELRRGEPRSQIRTRRTT